MFNLETLISLFGISAGLILVCIIYVFKIYNSEICNKIFDRIFNDSGTINKLRSYTIKNYKTINLSKIMTNIEDELNLKHKIKVGNYDILCLIPYNYPWPENKIEKTFVGIFFIVKNYFTSIF